MIHRFGKDFQQTGNYGNKESIYTNEAEFSKDVFNTPLTKDEMDLFLSGKSLNISKVRIATNEYEKAREKLASKVAAQNTDIAQKLIGEFEEKTGTVISKVVQGQKIIDYEKVRGVGEKKLMKLILKMMKDIVTYFF